LIGAKYRASSAYTSWGAHLFLLVGGFVWFGTARRKKIAEPHDIHFERVVVQYKRSGLAMFREILVLEHGKAKTKHGEGPREAETAKTEAKARESTYRD